MLTAKIKTTFGIARDWEQAGYFKTRQADEIGKEILNAVKGGHLIAVTGPVGIGKTTLIEHLEKGDPGKAGVRFARALSVAKNRIHLNVLITALFLDMADDPTQTVSTQPERRERLLRAALKSAGKPVVLIVDDAHDLSSSTLSGLKRLMETMAGHGTLSIILVGHPRLRNDLQRPSMEEIGHRTVRFALEGLGKDAEPYLDWLLAQCLDGKRAVDDVIESKARAFLVEKLNTPLQMTEHLDRAFADTFRIGKTTVTHAIVKETLSVGFDDLEARLARSGYTTPKVLADQFPLSPAEARRFLKHQLDAKRTAELTHLLRQGGLPI